MRNVAISLCDLTGNMVRPWAEAGYDCYCIDVQHSIRNDRVEEVGAGRITYQWGDVRSWRPSQDVANRLAIAFGFPPCTHTSRSGARDWRKKGCILLRDSLELFSACEMAFGWAGVPYMIENTVGKFSDHMGPPDHYFQPWNWGDLFFKKTCLWVGNGFVMPQPTFPFEPEDVQHTIHQMAPGKDRANKRSETPSGFARAVFEANHIHSVQQREDFYDS